MGGGSGYLVSGDCLHENRLQYNEFENEDTGEIVDMDFDVCKDCKAILVGNKIMGYDI